MTSGAHLSLSRTYTQSIKHRGEEQEAHGQGDGAGDGKNEVARELAKWNPGEVRKLRVAMASPGEKRGGGSAKGARP